MLENLSPAAIETISQIVLGVIVLLASLLGIRIGVNRNKKSGGDDEAESLHEIKGAIISDRKAGEILQAMEDVRESNEQLLKGIHELCSAIGTLRESVRDAKQEFKDTLRDFRMELQYALRETKR